MVLRKLDVHTLKNEIRPTSSCPKNKLHMKRETSSSSSLQDTGVVKKGFFKIRTLFFKKLRPTADRRDFIKLTVSVP